VAEARNRLSDLIDRALKGEGVVITRHGRPVVELKPVQAQPRAPTQADIDWLIKHRVAKVTSETNAGTLVSQMRDEDDSRF